MQDDLWEQALATNVGRVLTPVRPSDTFRRHLRSNLELASQQQAAKRAMRLQHPAHVNYWVLGAAALGVTVAAGSMVAWAVRTRFSPTHS
jgi:hypothetical protein